MNERVNMAGVHRLTVLVLLAVSASAACMTPTTANAQDQQRQSSLRLRRWVIRPQRQGRPVLTINLGNYGERIVRVGGISVGNDRWFVGVDATLQPGGVADLVVTVEKEPAYVTLNTSEGRFRFDLIPDR